jgi:hypothetical protein
MIQIRKAAERGHFDHGWLDTYHSIQIGAIHSRYGGCRVIGWRQHLEDRPRSSRHPCR